MYRFIPPLIILVPHDSNVALYVQVHWLCRVLYTGMPLFDNYCWQMPIDDFFSKDQNQLVAWQKRPFHLKWILLLLFVRDWELSHLAFPCKPAIALPCNPPFSTETFSREGFDTKYTHVPLMGLLTDWQVIIQSVFPVSQEQEFE